MGNRSNHIMVSYGDEGNCISRLWESNLVLPLLSSDDRLIVSSHFFLGFYESPR